MVLSMAISGTIGISVTFSEQSPVNAVFFRCFIGGIGLILYCLYKGYHKELGFSLKEYIMLTLGALTLIFNWVFLFTAYKMTSIGIATIVYHFQPFLLLFGGILFLRDRISFSNIAWMLIAFLGVIIVVMPESSSEGGRIYILGCVSALAAAFLYASTTLITKSISNEIRPEIIAASHMIIGAIVFSFLADYSDMPSSTGSIFSTILLGLFHTTFLYVLLYTAFKKASTTSLAIFGFLYPLVAVLVDLLVFGKTVSYVQIVGGVMIIGSGLLYNYGVNIREVFNTLHPPVKIKKKRWPKL